MDTTKMPGNFYDKIKPRLYRRVGKELRLAHRVLELGCGDCGLAQYLAQTYEQDVTGIDITANSFPSKAILNKNGGRIRCIRKDASRLEFIRTGTKDAVIIFWALHEMKHPQAVLRESHRVLRPGGELLVVEFPRNSLAKALWRENYFTIKQLHLYCRNAQFEQVRIRRIEGQQILWVTAFRSQRRTA